MIRGLYDKLSRTLAILCGVFAMLSLAPAASASPFGQGVFGADVPFGSLTSISIALDSDVAIAVTPSGSDFVGQGSHTITVTSTDVVGYNLYIYSPGSTDMTSGGDVISASGNAVAAALATNTWGYNTDGSTNYFGMTTLPVLLKNAPGPYKNGDNTDVYYGLKTDITKSNGDYSVSVAYTAVALNY